MMHTVLIKAVVFYSRMLNGVVWLWVQVSVLEGMSVREAVVIPEITRIDLHSLDLNLFCLVMDCTL